MKFPSVAKLVDDFGKDGALHEIATVNLICAAGLPGAESLDISQCLKTLSAWTDRTAHYTRDAIQEFDDKPGKFHHQRGFAFFQAMVTLLRHPHGFNIQYQPSAIGNFDFLDARDDFIHGMLTRRLGTCASMPVLYVSIGRRLGYPIYLACSNGHFYCQWINDDGTHLNLEGSCASGSCMFSDDYYRKWPHPLTPDLMALDHFLRPLQPHEELAAFLQTRANCFSSNGRFGEAAEALALAHKAAPAFAMYQRALADLAMKVVRYENNLFGRVNAAPAEHLFTVIHGFGTIQSNRRGIINGIFPINRHLALARS